MIVKLIQTILFAFAFIQNTVIPATCLEILQKNSKQQWKVETGNFAN